VFHRHGRRLVRFDTAWDEAREGVALPRLLFHDLRRSGARDCRRAGVGEDVIRRIGGWKTASMFKRYNIVDERDLVEAGERLSVSLTDAASAAPPIVPNRGCSDRQPRGQTRPEHGQSGRGGGCAGPRGSRKFLRSHCAGMAELADAADLKVSRSSATKSVDKGHACSRAGSEERLSPCSSGGP